MTATLYLCVYVCLCVSVCLSVCLCVDESYSVPLDVEMSVSIKPRSLSGVLLSVFSHGTGPPGGDYLVLQLVNGKVSIVLCSDYCA